MAVTGFVVPRLMDRELGQATLGVWDFACLASPALRRQARVFLARIPAAARLGR